MIFFNITNVLVSFQGYVNKILAEKLNIFVIVYLNNVLVYMKDSGQAYLELFDRF